jgi:hypothetical protein
LKRGNEMREAVARVQPPLVDPIVAFGIGGLSVVVAVAWIWTWSRHQPRTRLWLASAVAGVMAISAVAAMSGLLARFDVRPPPMAVMLVSIFALAFALGLSPFGKSVATQVPYITLIGLQAFRLPLELVMHRAATLGIMPPELSYSGYNFDIVSGATALALWAFLRSGTRVPTWLLWLWNLWGCYCLCAIAVIAIATSPMVRFFGDTERHLNTWVLFFPYVWLPVVLVTVAVTTHIVVTRRLLMETGG